MACNVSASGGCLGVSRFDDRRRFSCSAICLSMSRCEEREEVCLWTPSSCEDWGRFQYWFGGCGAGLRICSIGDMKIFRVEHGEADAGMIVRIV